MVLATQLKPLIEQQLGYATELLSVMRAEHEFLSRHDSESLNRIVEQKQRLLVELESSSVKLFELLQSQGLTADRAGIEAAIASSPQHDTLAEQWATLQQTLNDAQQQNLVNGQIMEVSRRGTEQALSILLGHGQSEPGLYDGRGSTNRTLGGKSHIKV